MQKSKMFALLEKLKKEFTSFMVAIKVETSQRANTGENTDHIKSNLALLKIRKRQNTSKNITPRNILQSNNR